MADKKISQLTGATTPLAGTEVLPIVQGGSTVKVSVDNLTAGKTVKATTFDTDVAAAKVTLTGTTLAASGTDANININITPKGTGEVALPKVNIDAGAIDGTPIGASSASTGSFTTLQAAGNMTVTAAGNYVKNNTSGSDSLAFSSNSSGTGANFLQLVNSGGTYNVGVENSASTYWGTPAYSMTLAIPNTRSFTVFAGGVGQLLTANSSTTNVTVDQGNLVVGTAAKGIDFSANTGAAGETSALLDWYEEGTFTATLTAATTAPSTPVTTTAYYTRIGRQVTVTAYFGNKDTTGASGTMQVTGLPFTSGVDSIGACAKSGLGATSDAAIIFATTSVVYFTDTTTQTNTAITAGSGKYLWFSLTYFV
jgi:hypothetical protein